MKQTIIISALALFAITQNITQGAEKKGGASAEHANKAVQLAQQGAYEPAIEEFNKAVEANPKDARLYNDRGGLYLTMKKFQEAVTDFGKAIELAPKDARGYSMRGAAEIELAQYDPAAADLAKALELKPNDPQTLERRGYLEYKQKNYQPALDDLNNALTQDPSSTLGLSRRADVYAAMNQWANAGADLQQLIKLRPDDFTAQDRLMQVQARLQTAQAPRPQEAAPTIAPTPAPTPKPKLLTRENIFIALGALVVLVIVGAIVGKMMNTRSAD